MLKLNIILLQLHMFDNTKNDKEMSQEFVRLLSIIKKGNNHNSNHMCLAEWHEINKPKSWVHFSTSSLNNPTALSVYLQVIITTLISCLFVNSLSQYCSSHMAVNIARIHEVSASKPCRYQIQVWSPGESRM
jgi:hypothetical protein